MFTSLLQSEYFSCNTLPSIIGMFRRPFATAETHLYTVSQNWQDLLPILPYNASWPHFRTTIPTCAYIFIQYPLHSTSASGLIQYLSSSVVRLQSIQIFPVHVRSHGLRKRNSANGSNWPSQKRSFTLSLWIHKPVGTMTVFWMQAPP